MFDNLLAKGFTLFAQVMVKIQPIWDKYKALIGLVVGVLLGWLILGWWLFPVGWSDASPGHLHARYRSAYLAYASEEFYRTGDVTLLQSRLGLDLATNKDVRVKDIPWLADQTQLQKDLATAVNGAPQWGLDNYLSSLTGLEQISVQNPDALFAVEAPATEEEATTTTTLATAVKTIGIAAGVLLVIGAAGLGWYVITGRNRATPAEDERLVAQRDAAPAGTAQGFDEDGQPVKSFSTPYVLGDDYFDPSFSIEIGADFLGECGIGISETLGAGDPKKVTAFEAWLFDKSDIRTVTKVLASEYAYRDEDLRAKLQPKGDVVMMRPGEEIILETSALRVKARIKELEYAQGANLPPNSFVQKVNFELQAWVKQADELIGLEEDYV